MSDKKLIPVGYDTDKLPNTDEFDPIAWYEGTGEDLGVPQEYFDRVEAARKARPEKEPNP